MAVFFRATYLIDMMANNFVSASYFNKDSMKRSEVHLCLRMHNVTSVAEICILLCSLAYTLLVVLL